MKAQKLILDRLRKEFERIKSVLVGRDGTNVWVMAAEMLPFAETILAAMVFTFYNSTKYVKRSLRAKLSR